MKQLIKKNWILILILLMAGFLRFLGEYPGFPDNHPDEGISFTTGVYMLYHFMRPNIFYYPAGVPFIQIVFYLVFFIPIALFRLFIYQPDSLIQFFTKGFGFFTQYRDTIFGLRDINAMYWSRYIVGFTGVCAVALAYKVTKKLFNKEAGLIAAFFLAINYRHVMSSHIGVPDVYNGFFSLLAFYACYLIFEKQTRRRYVLAGISMGLAIAMKYQIFVLLPFALVHLILFFKKRKFNVVFNSGVILSILISICIFFLINPYLIMNLKEFFYQSDLTYRWYQMGNYKFRFYPYFYLFHWGIGEFTSIVIVLSIFFMARKKILEFLLLSSFVVPFFFLLTIYSNGGIYTRNFSTVMPFLVIYAGYLISLLLGYAKKFLWAPIFIVAVVIVLNFPSIKNSFLLSYYYSKTWDSDVLMKWMDAKLPSNITLRNHNLLLAWKNRDQFFSIIESKHIAQSEWNYSQRSSSLAEFQAENVDFVILNDNILQSVTYWWREWDTNKLIKHSDVPIDYIRNGFFGLSTMELMNYTVHEIYKPWQAIEANNYLVFKIPSKLKEVGHKIAEFHFDSNNEMWTMRGLMNLKPFLYSFTPEIGKNKNGSIAISGESEGNTSRIGSSAVPIKAEKIYTVRGWIKNAAEKLGIDKESFLRIDFYKEADKLDALGISVALSPRAPIANDWVQEDAQAKAPDGAKYMTISFQRVNLPRSVPLRSFTSYLDDVEVFENSTDTVEKYNELPYVKSSFPLENLYPNTFF